MMDFIEDFFTWFAIVMTVVFILMSALFLISGQVTAGDFMSNLLP